MEAVARRAQVSKVTLYKHFADKQALFEATVEQVIGDARAEMDAAAARAANAQDKIGAVLTAKAEFFFRLLDPSPFASEFHAVHAHGAVKAFAAMDTELAARVGAWLGEVGVADAAGLSSLLKSCAAGISQEARQVGDIAPAIKTVVAALIGAARPDRKI